MSQFENDGTFGARKVSDRIITCVAMTVLTVTLCAQTARAPADELVQFDSAAYRVGQLQQRLARERAETMAEVPRTTIEGYLSKPDGSGPFPAVVYLHGCSWMEGDLSGIGSNTTLMRPRAQSWKCTTSWLIN